MRQIVITDTEPGSYGFPWRNDSTCYNFKFPRESVHSDDIDKITDRSDIDALVIACDLSDYSFISDMTDLTQLYIYSGEHITDLSFIENLIHLQQLLVVGTHITSIEPLLNLVAEKSRLLAAADDKDKRGNAYFEYAFEGICLQSDRLDCNPNDLPDERVLRTNEIIINGKKKRY